MLDYRDPISTKPAGSRVPTLPDQLVKAHPIASHPLRHQLNNEVHARPPTPLGSPERVSYLAIHSGEQGAADDHACLVRLCERYGITPPQAGVNHFSQDFGPFRLKWERHTEFVTYTFFVQGGTSEAPFGSPAIDLVALDWLSQLPDQTLVAAHVAVLPSEAPAPTGDEVSCHFSTDSVIGSLVSGGAATVFTDYRIHADGFSRILIYDHRLGRRQAGRLVQRLLEVEAYRMMALLALPVASRNAPDIAHCERNLADITASMTRSDGVEHERQLLDRLIQLATSIERMSAATGYRFRAARAYHNLVERRIAELREERIPGLQTIAEFMDRRFQPAMRTLISTAERLESLSQRTTRASDLLRTGIDITMAEQHRDLLRSMDQRARLQLLLNEAVEGLSVVVITYYALGLIGYGLKSLKPVDLDVDPDVVTGLALPIVFALVWLNVRRLRKKLLD
jgi:uncharacterized membrane-anchored protein